MFLRQLIEQSEGSEFDKKLIDLFGDEQAANRAIAMLLFSVSPNLMYNKFTATDDHKSDMISAFARYPRVSNLSMLLKLLNSHLANDSQNLLVKEYYNFSKQEIADGMKQIKDDRNKGVSGVDRLYNSDSYVTPADNQVPLTPTKPVDKPTSGSSGYSHRNVPSLAKRELVKPYKEYSDKPIDRSDWDPFDVPHYDMIPKYPEGANVSGVYGNISDGDTLYKAYVKYVVGIALGRNLSDRLAVFNNDARGESFLQASIDKDPFYPGDVDINQAINMWNDQTSYAKGQQKGNMVAVGDDYEYYQSKLHQLTDIPRYMWITPELADIVRKNYKADQDDARAGALDVGLSSAGPQRRTVNTSTQQHWVEYDLEVFAANLDTLNKLGGSDKLNTIKDPMLQLAMMGDPRQKKIAKYGRWDQVRFEVTPTGYLGVYKNSVSTGDSKSGDSTAVTLMDRALGLDQTAISKTLAHEMRHRAFQMIMAIPELRDAMPDDLRKGGVWWNSWGGLWDKSDKGATAEHAMIYTMDWGTQVPNRRMSFFDNDLFNTQDYPLSYWRDLYYKTSKVVGDFLKKVGAKEITPANLDVIDPDNPERNEQRDNANATLLQLTPGLAEMYRYIIETGQLPALEAVEDVYNFFDKLATIQGEMALKIQYRKQLVGRISHLLGDLKYGDFARAHKMGIPRAKETLKQFQKKSVEELAREERFGLLNPVRTVAEMIDRYVKIVDDIEAGLNQFQDVTILRPSVFRSKLSKGEIKPVSFGEIKKLLPYTLGDLPDYNSGFTATDDAPLDQIPYVPE